MCQIPGQTAAAPPQAGTLLQGNQAQQAEPYQGLLKMVSPRKRHSTKKRRASNYTITARVPAATRQQISSISQPPMQTQSILQVPQWPQAQAFQGAPGMQVIPAVFPPTGPFAAQVHPASLLFGGAGLTNFAGLLPGGVCYVLLLDTKVTYTPHASPINSTILHVLTKSFDKLFTNILLI